MENRLPPAQRHIAAIPETFAVAAVQREGSDRLAHDWRDGSAAPVDHSCDRAHRATRSSEGNVVNTVNSSAPRWPTTGTPSSSTQTCDANPPVAALATP